MKIYELLLNDELKTTNEISLNATSNGIVASQYINVSNFFINSEAQNTYYRSGGFCVVPSKNECYCIKTNGGETKSVLFRINLLTKKEVETHKVISNTFGHGNGMTYSSKSSIYVTCGSTDTSVEHSGVVRVPFVLANYSSKSIKFASSKQFMSIAHYGTNDFISKNVSDTTSYPKYTHYSVNTTDKTINEKGNSFYLYNPKAVDRYTIFQDICYYNNNLYVILYRKDTDQPSTIANYKTSNIILRYNITTTGNPEHNGLPCYEPDVMYVSKKDSSKYSSYEIESLDFDSSGNMFIFAGFVDKSNNRNDSIFKVEKSDLDS